MSEQHRILHTLESSPCGAAQRYGAKRMVNNFLPMNDNLHSWMSGLGRLKDQNPVPVLAVICGLAFLAGLKVAILERRRA